MRTAAASLAAALLSAACSAGGAPTTTPVTTPGRSVFLAHPSVRCDLGKENAIWCASWPLAWDSLARDVLQGPVDLGPPAPAGLVASLNADPFPRASLDPASYIALAGRRDSGILDRIAQEGREKFQRRLPQMSVSLQRPDDILAYAFLRKDLPFEKPFETVAKGVQFPGRAQPVGAFGYVPGGHKRDVDKLLRQARVLYRSAPNLSDRVGPEGESFVLEFTPKGGKDRILLACFPPGETLEATWKKVDAAMRAGPSENLHEDAVLKVPRLHFDLEHSYAEFVGAPVRNKGFEKYEVADARQSVLFRLDEAGALLESEAAIVLKEVSVAMRRPQVFVFDRPFLLALREGGAEKPYFLLWVANADLMPN